MIRSLRLRFFLIMWPLVVVAVGGVAWSFARWTEVELNEMITGFAEVPDEALAALRDSVGVRLTDLAGAPAADSTLSALVTATGLVGQAAIIAAPGDLLASTDTSLQIRIQPQGPNGQAEFERETAGVINSLEVLRLSGIPILSGPTDPQVWLYFLPPAEALTDQTVMPTIRADARRTLWVAVLLASATAAAAALFLAGPMIRQITRLAESSAAVQRGDLATRVPSGSKDELGRLEQSFNAMAESLEAAELLKRTMVSDVAHELRTPLTNLVGTLEAIQDGLRVPDQATVASLREEAGLLSSLVGELQDLALAESGQLVFDVIALDAVEEAGAALAASSALAGGISLVGPTQSAPIPVCADPRRLRQVLSNLIRNAITHTGAGGTITVEVEEGDAWVAFVVADTGSGIPPAHVGLVWERFHRVDPSRDRASGGMGLGLAVVRQLVLAMNGQVEVTSQEGVGSAFTVRLPRVKVRGP